MQSKKGTSYLDRRKSFGVDFPTKEGDLRTDLLPQEDENLITEEDDYESSRPSDHVPEYGISKAELDQIVEARKEYRTYILGNLKEINPVDPFIYNWEESMYHGFSILSISIISLLAISPIIETNLLHPGFGLLTAIMAAGFALIGRIAMVQQT